jgi:hypothetical protein
MSIKSELQALADSWRQDAYGYRDCIPGPYEDKDAKDRDRAKADKLDECANDLEKLMKKMSTEMFSFMNTTIHH